MASSHSSFVTVNPAYAAVFALLAVSSLCLVIVAIFTAVFISELYVVAACLAVQLFIKQATVSRSLFAAAFALTVINGATILAALLFLAFASGLALAYLQKD